MVAAKQSGEMSRDYMADAMILAKPVGKRISSTGRTYYEYRGNRSDTEDERLWHGGGIKKKDEIKKTIDKLKAKAAKAKKPAKTISVKAAPKTAPKVEIPLKPKGGAVGAASAKIREIIESIPKRGDLVTPRWKRNTIELSFNELLEVGKAYGRVIHQRSVENNLVIDKYGNCLYHVSGSRRRVRTTVEQYNAGALVIHNHPSRSTTGNPQSPQDIANVFFTDPYMQMVVSYGRWYLVSKPKTMPYDSTMERKCIGEFNRIYDEYERGCIDYTARSCRVGVKHTRSGLEYINTYKLSIETFKKSSERAYYLYSATHGVWQDRIIKKYFASVINAKYPDVKYTQGVL